jgi:pentose-5-phosphate-3-epimerase
VAAIKDNFIGFLTRINQANSVKSKRIMYLQEADACLQTLKMLFRLSVNKKFIKQAFYEDISESLTEVNKLLVGYFKSASNKDYKSNFSK